MTLQTEAIGYHISEIEKYSAGVGGDFDPLDILIIKSHIEEITDLCRAYSMAKTFLDNEETRS